MIRITAGRCLLAAISSYHLQSMPLGVAIVRKETLTPIN